MIFRKLNIANTNVDLKILCCKDNPFMSYRQMVSEENSRKGVFDTVYENQHPVILYLLLLHPYYSIFVHLDIKSCGKLTTFSINSQENTLFLCHIFKL